MREEIRPQPSVQLADLERHRVTAILEVGCDRETAAHYVGKSVGDLRREMDADEEFAVAVRRAEASAELKHMRNVLQAADDKKNWRTSVWWLERRCPQRYGSRRAGAVSGHQLDALVAQLIDALEKHAADARRTEKDSPPAAVTDPTASG